MELLTIRFICDGIFDESGKGNQFDDILLKPFRDAGYNLEMIYDYDKSSTFTYKISKLNKIDK